MFEIYRAVFIVIFVSFVVGPVVKIRFTTKFTKGTKDMVYPARAGAPSGGLEPTGLSEDFASALE